MNMFQNCHVLIWVTDQKQYTNFHATERKIYKTLFVACQKLWLEPDERWMIFQAKLSQNYDFDIILT